MKNWSFIVYLSFVAIATGCNNANEKNAERQVQTETDGTRRSVRSDANTETTFTMKDRATSANLSGLKVSGYTYDPTNGTTSNGGAQRPYQFTYDPTNGTTSNGVYRVKQ